MRGRRQPHYQIHKPAKTADALAPPDSVAQVYLNAGSHPDIVARVWDELGAALPRESCMLFYGTPALVHPVTSEVLALALGTQYALRLPPARLVSAAATGVKTIMRWSNGAVLDLRETLGHDWIVGTFAADEIMFCSELYEAISPSV